MDTQLPAILALLGVLITVLSNIIIGFIKSRSDKQISESNDEGEFQDRLLAAYKVLQEKNDRLEDRNGKLQEELDAKRNLLHQEIDDKYELENKLRIVERELKEKEEYITKMEKKVWYRGVPSKDVLEGE